jgi:hypothetical protein
MAAQEIAWELAKMAGTGLVAGLFTAWVTMRDHRYKKWWELRVAAYQVVIDALSDLAYIYNSRLNLEYKGNELDKESEQHMSTVAGEAFVKVRKAADSGAFLFSEGANEILAAFRKELDQNYETYFDHLDGLAAVSRTCLNELVALARKDLQVDRPLTVW